MVIINKLICQAFIQTIIINEQEFPSLRATIPIYRLFEHIVLLHVCIYEIKSNL